MSQPIEHKIFFLDSSPLFSSRTKKFEAFGIKNLTCTHSLIDFQKEVKNYINTQSTNKQSKLAFIICIPIHSEIIRHDLIKNSPHQVCRKIFIFGTEDQCSKLTPNEKKTFIIYASKSQKEIVSFMRKVQSSIKILKNNSPYLLISSQSNINQTQSASQKEVVSNSFYHKTSFSDIEKSKMSASVKKFLKNQQQQSEKSDNKFPCEVSAIANNNNSQMVISQINSSSLVEVESQMPLNTNSNMINILEELNFIKEPEPKQKNSIKSDSIKDFKQTQKQKSIQNLIKQQQKQTKINQFHNKLQQKIEKLNSELENVKKQKVQKQNSKQLAILKNLGIQKMQNANTVNSNKDEQISLLNDEIYQIQKSVGDQKYISNLSIEQEIEKQPTSNQQKDDILSEKFENSFYHLYTQNLSTQDKNHKQEGLSQKQIIQEKQKIKNIDNIDNNIDNNENKDEQRDGNICQNEDGDRNQQIIQKSKQNYDIKMKNEQKCGKLVEQYNQKRNEERKTNKQEQQNIELNIAGELGQQIQDSNKKQNVKQLTESISHSSMYSQFIQKKQTKQQIQENINKNEPTIKNKVEFRANNSLYQFKKRSNNKSKLNKIKTDYHQLNNYLGKQKDRLNFSNSDENMLSNKRLNKLKQQSIYLKKKTPVFKNCYLNQKLQFKNIEILWADPNDFNQGTLNQLREILNHKIKITYVNHATFSQDSILVQQFETQFVIICSNQTYRQFILNNIYPFPNCQNYFIYCSNTDYAQHNLNFYSTSNKTKYTNNNQELLGWVSQLISRRYLEIFHRCL